MLIGRITKSTGKLYHVRLENGEIITCKLRGKIRLDELKSTNPIAVGDEVKIEISESLAQKEGLIYEINPRKNYLVRRSVNLSKKLHILASNIDRIYLVITLHSPQTHLAFIDRFLTSAESFRIPVTLLFNKIDMLSQNELNQLNDIIQIYEGVGYKCYKLSAINNENVAFLKAEIKDKQVMFGGHSGTGKSTLINSLDENLHLKIGKISAYHRQGQHTTTFAEMHELKSGGYIIDTPGIKSFGIIEIEKEAISHFFPEMRKLLNSCKFHNCLHINEPDCTIKHQVEIGKIASSRYKNYVDLMSSSEDDSFRMNDFK